MTKLLNSLKECKRKTKREMTVLTPGKKEKKKGND